MAAVAAPELPEEDWDEEPMLPPGHWTGDKSLIRLLPPKAVKLRRVNHGYGQKMEKHPPRSSPELTQRDKLESSRNPPVGTWTLPMERLWRFQN